MAIREEKVTQKRCVNQRLYNATHEASVPKVDLFRKKAYWINILTELNLFKQKSTRPRSPIVEFSENLFLFLCILKMAASCCDGRQGMYLAPPRPHKLRYFAALEILRMFQICKTLNPLLYTVILTCQMRFEKWLLVLDCKRNLHTHRNRHFRNWDQQKMDEIWWSKWINLIIFTWLIKKLLFS